MAIDRDTLVGTVLGGLGTRADGLIPPLSWAFDAEASEPVPFDQEAARAGLVAAGWKEAEGGGWLPKGSTDPLTIEVLSPLAEANPAAYAIADAVAAAWQGIGLDVAHVAVSGAEFVGDRLQVGDFSVAVTGTTIGLDPDLYPLLASSQTTFRGSNYSGLQDAALDALLIKARAPGPEAARLAAYAALQTKLAIGTYYLPMAFPDVVVVVRDTLTGPGRGRSEALGTDSRDVLTWRLAAAR